MPGERMQSTKVVLILCSCFFAYGTFWSDWAFDYYFLWAKISEHPDAVSKATQYYINQLGAPDIIKYIPFVNLLIASLGFAAGLANMTEGNILFDGASLVLMIFAITTWSSSVKPGILTISQSTVEAEIVKQLKNIAAAHFIIVLAITGIVGLQITHYVLNKRADQEVVKSSETKKTK